MNEDSMPGDKNNKKGNKLKKTSKLNTTVKSDKIKEVVSGSSNDQNGKSNTSSQDTNKILDEMMEMIKTGNIDLFFTTLEKQSAEPSFSINSQNEYGNTLLHVACRSRKDEVVRVLLNDYNARIDIQNADGRTPLHIATIYGSTDKTCYILKGGSTKEQIASATDIISMLVNTAPYVLQIKDNDGMTAMNYFNIHSELSSNKTMNARYKSYKRVASFFDRLKESGVDNEDYKLTMSIYFALKRGQ
ncbi:hypothetical protein YASMINEVIRUS_154 [Yasminevirus sp. GU-2018]|uniref:Uncharacterized protein n=1 Tax=Yasminevirus sp. GU-2018 TaxID=2420051 RepID=A0A5K0U859_9VIRU|nr:hypothetical protein YASMINEVIRUS_154 [Yasminevirus sp. GU-2018]